MSSRADRPVVLVGPRLRSAGLYGRRHIDLHLFAGALCCPTSAH